MDPPLPNHLPVVLIRPTNTAPRLLVGYYVTLRTQFAGSQDLERIHCYKPILRAVPNFSTTEFSARIKVSFCAQEKQAARRGGDDGGGGGFDCGFLLSSSSSLML